MMSLPLRVFCHCSGRVAVTLLELAEHFGESVGEDRIVIRQRIRQPDLAAMAGIARENLNRILVDWSSVKNCQHPDLESETAPKRQ